MEAIRRCELNRLCEERNFVGDASREQSLARDAPPELDWTKQNRIELTLPEPRFSSVSLLLLSEAAKSARRA